MSKVGANLDLKTVKGVEDAMRFSVDGATLFASDHVAVVGPPTDELLRHLHLQVNRNLFQIMTTENVTEILEILIVKKFKFVLKCSKHSTTPRRSFSCL